MPIAAIALLIASASLHTAWNLLLKRAPEKYIVTWWIVVIGGIISVVALAFTGLPPTQVWMFVVFSVLIEAAYFGMLSYAYRDHDFSLIYPIARGAAPAFLIGWTFLFLQERPTPGGIAGLALIILGLAVIGAGGLRPDAAGDMRARGVAAALFTALLISAYTAIDGAAVKRVPALPYALIVFALIPLPVTPFVMRRYGWPHLMAVWREQRRRLPIISLLGIVAYIFALLAYRIAPLSYSGAIREVSVVMGAFAGWRLLGESMGGLRVAGAAVIFVGILVIAILG